MVLDSDKPALNKVDKSEKRSHAAFVDSLASWVKLSMSGTYLSVWCAHMPKGKAQKTELGNCIYIVLYFKLKCSIYSTHTHTRCVGKELFKVFNVKSPSGASCFSHRPKFTVRGQVFCVTSLRTVNLRRHEYVCFAVVGTIKKRS